MVEAMMNNEDSELVLLDGKKVSVDMEAMMKGYSEVQSFVEDEQYITGTSDIMKGKGY